MPPPPRGRLTRTERARTAARIADDHGGVAHRRDLRAAGVTRADVRTEVTAGRWRTAGRHTVAIGNGHLTDVARRWQAVWESGSGAVLDGASSLHAVGLRGYETPAIHVTVPRCNRSHDLEGVRVRRRASIGPVAGAGIPRVRTERAAIHAAHWARTDREAALVICLVVQQRLTSPTRLLAAWTATRRSPRRALLDAVIRDVCDGAQSLGELDFAGLCRRRGLPAPTRQAVRTAPGGRVYLDVAWEDVGLVVEVGGGHHALALNPVDDALRQNEVTLGHETVLRVPVLGLRLAPDAFMDQVARARADLSTRCRARAAG